VIEGSGKNTALPGYAPIPYRLVDQKMKESVICGRYCAPETGLLRLTGFPVG